MLDTGPLWFVGVLLIFSLASAASLRMRRHGVTVRGDSRPNPLFCQPGSRWRLSGGFAFSGPRTG